MALRENCDRWNEQWVARCSASTTPTFRWYQVDGKTARDHILEALRNQTQRHCSFCDAFPVAGVTNEPIEHFRPKNQFPSYAYTWTNLYYCCNACQSAKGEKWDERLLHADSAEFEFSRYFEFDFTTGQIRPDPFATDPDQKRAQVTIELYSLDSSHRRSNRLDELRNYDKNSEIDRWAYRDFVGMGGPRQF